MKKEDYNDEEYFEEDMELISLGIPTYYDRREFKRPGIREFIFDFFGIDLGLNIPEKYKRK